MDWTLYSSSYLILRSCYSIAQYQLRTFKPNPKLKLLKDVWTEFLCPKCGKNLKFRNLILRKTIHYLHGVLAGTTQQNLKCRKILNQETLFCHFVVIVVYKKRKEFGVGI